MKRKTQNLFKLLAKNSLRVLQRSKILMLQLGILLSIGIIVIVTIFSSTFLLSQSKNRVIKSGNLADLTVSIPVEKLNESVSANKNSDTTNIFSGKTPADLQLQTYLKSQGLDYTFSKNLTMSDITSGSSFILSLANLQKLQDDSVINKLVTNDFLPVSVYDNNDRNIALNSSYFSFLRNIITAPNDKNIVKKGKWYFNYQNYIANKPWKLAQMLCNSMWNLSQNTTNNIIRLLVEVSIPPANEVDYNKNYNPFIGDPTVTLTYNTESYFYKLAHLFSITRAVYNGHGYTFFANQIIPLIGIGAEIPFQIEYNDKSAFFSILSSNYMDANAGSKVQLHPRTITDVMALPYKSNLSGDDSLNPNQSYQVYNQDTGLLEPQKDFLTWFNNLDDKYKISINSLTYLIAGKGDSPNLLYPVQSPTQLLVDSKSNGVAYINNLGFNRALDGTSYQPTVYYSVRYPPSVPLFTKEKILRNLENWTTTNYGEITAFDINDPNQPNHLFYVWANFLNNLQYIVTTIGGIIGGIVVLLAFIFISLLIRSIIKINKVTFGVGLANGISKWKLALSFFPFALIPAIIFGTVGFFASYFLISPTLDVVRNYWTLSIASPTLQVWLYFAIVGATFLFLYLLIIAIIFISLRHNTQTILNSTNSLRINPLIIWTKGLTNKLSPLWSFRLTFAMSNVSRFVILLFSVISIITLSSTIVSTSSLFKTSLESVTNNKKYFTSYDLYTPTINSGYYSAIPYNMLGTSQQGMFNNYNTNGQNNYASPEHTVGDFYTGIDYNNALTYPYASNLYFTSLFMTNSNLANEINYNIQFMDNRVFSKLLLDVDVNALGALLNPWEFAKQIMPESIRYLAEHNTDLLVKTNFDFYVWLQEQNKIALSGDSTKYINIPGLENTEFAQFNNKPITYKTFLPNISGQPFTLNNSDINIADLNNPVNQKDWIIVQKLNPLTNKYSWYINQDYAINAAPSFTIKSQAAQLFVQIMTNNANPLFKFWYSYCYDDNPNKGKPNQVIPDYNYKMSTMGLPVNESDETYTYLDSNLLLNNWTPSVKINGIKPNSTMVYLYDKHGRDLKTKLTQFTVSTIDVKQNDGTTKTYKVYPLVINNVVAKKYGMYIGESIFVDTKNTFDRFNLINTNQNPNYTCVFEIVGITDTNYGDDLYTLQSYANEIIGFGDPSNDSQTNAWSSRIKPGKNYIPFNGVFTKDQTLQMVRNYAGLYSPSGLSTILGNWGEKADQNNLGAMSSLFLNNSEQLDNIMNLNCFVDRTKNNAIITKQLTESQKISFPSKPNFQKIADAMNKIIDLFGLPSAIVSQLQNVDSPYITAQMGNSFDQVLTKIGIITIVSMIPTLVIIICLLAVIVIFESTRLISLMKILGYGDNKNLFSFMFVYIMVLVLGTILAVPFTFIINEIISAISFISFSIIATPIVPWWIFFAGFGVVGTIFASLFIFVYSKLKRINLAQEISVK